MVKKIIALLLLVCLTASVSVAQTFDFRRNDDAATVTGQVNTTPAQAGITRYREAFTTTKPGLFACNAAAETGTASKTVIAAAALTSHYIKGYTCYNNSTVASIINFRDGTTSFWQDIIGTSTLGTNRISYNFPHPKKLTVNTAFTFIMTTTATSTVCCVNYLDEPNP